MLLKKAFPNDPWIGTSAFAMPKKIVSATSLVTDTVGGLRQEGWINPR
jgi:hypothetical protein